MSESTTMKTIEQRVIQTLQLAEERGYNLTIPQLAAKLLGGSIPEVEVRRILPMLSTIETDNDFLATKGHLYLEKCLQRRNTNTKLQLIYQRIAHEFIDEYTRLCPWVACMLLSGSIASEGLGEGDDIDFDLIVPDGLKYTSYLLALLLSFKYSLIYGKHFWRGYVICISVVWETRQVLPFRRTDRQLAFELLNANVVYNPDFFKYVLRKNEWLHSFFPQMYQQPHLGNPPSTEVSERKKHTPPRFIENISRNILFLMVAIAMKTIFRDHNIRHHMMVKHPYAMFDVPEKK